MVKSNAPDPNWIFTEALLKFAVVSVLAALGSTAPRIRVMPLRNIRKNSARPPMPEPVSYQDAVDQLFRISRDLGQQRMYLAQALDNQRKAEEYIKSLEARQEALKQRLKELL